jgi:hypothetical protein
MNVDLNTDHDELPDDDTFLHLKMVAGFGELHEAQVARRGVRSPVTTLELTMSMIDSGNLLYELRENEPEGTYITRFQRRVAALCVRHCPTRNSFSEAKDQGQSNHHLFRRHPNEADKQIRWSLEKLELPVSGQPGLFFKQGKK